MSYLLKSFRYNLKPLYSNIIHYKKLLGYRNFGVKVYKCPEPGEGTYEVDILEWMVKPGDIVKSLDIIGKAKYEKADIDIVSPYSAKINKLLVNAGTIAKVGEPLVEFETDDNTNDNIVNNNINNNNNIDKQSDIQSSAQKTEYHMVINGKVLATPAVRRLAMENNIDLNLVTPTGKDGRITKDDILLYIQNGGNQSQQQISSIPQQQQQQQQSSTTMNTKIIAREILHPLKSDHIEKIIGVKRAMVRKMNESLNVPTFGYSDEYIINELINVRKKLKEIGKEYGINLSFMPFILKACSLSLLEYPSLNAETNNDCTELIYKGNHNIGVAVDTSDGLVVPVIKNCEQKSIMEIAKDLDDIIIKARNGNINTNDMADGTFTISNIGVIGGTYCRPVNFYPQVCIGAIGAVKSEPKYNENGDIYKANLITVSWSADHRVIDGATMARFSNQVKHYLEYPSAMLLNLK